MLLSETCIFFSFFEKREVLFLTQLCFCLFLLCAFLFVPAKIILTEKFYRIYTYNDRYFFQALRHPGYIGHLQQIILTKYDFLINSIFSHLTDQIPDLKRLPLVIILISIMTYLTLHLLMSTEPPQFPSNSSSTELNERVLINL